MLGIGIVNLRVKMGIVSPAPVIIRVIVFTIQLDLQFKRTVYSYCPVGFCVQEPDDLFETVSQALLNAVDRDCLSGWGAVVHVM